jgi:hypothetical protein
MYKFLLTSLCILIIVLLSPVNNSYSWGFFAHKKINKYAVYTLPPEMVVLYKKHIEYISENAIGPDCRRYSDPDEAPRHYIDIDHYSKENPFEVMPPKWKDAVAKYGEDTLKAYGIVPWHVLSVLYKLTDAFKENDLSKILRASSDIGHYISDAHVPLHTTENYNGQLTGQKGIHGFWESRVPELYAEDYDYFVGRAQYINRPLDYIWKVIQQSHAALDSVLLFEKQLTDSFPPDKKYSYETRGQNTIKVYSKEFTAAYNQKLNGMVERRMIHSVIAIGSFWYTAWIDAGKPDLKILNDKELSAQLKQQQKEEEKMWRTGKGHGREHE